MIIRGSRYVTATVVKLTSRSHPNGVATVVDRKNYTIDNLTHGWTFRTPGNDDLDQIAYRIAGREGMWFLLADVNEIVDPFRPIPTGTSIIIPSKQSFADVQADLTRHA